MALKDVEKILGEGNAPAPELAASVDQGNVFPSEAIPAARAALKHAYRNIFLSNENSELKHGVLGKPNIVPKYTVDQVDSYFDEAFRNHFDLGYDDSDGSYESLTEGIKVKGKNIKVPVWGTSYENAPADFAPQWSIRIDKDSGINLTSSSLRFVARINIDVAAFAEHLKSIGFPGTGGSADDTGDEDKKQVTNTPWSPTDPDAESKLGAKGSATHYVNIKGEDSAGNPYRAMVRWHPEAYVPPLKDHWNYKGPLSIISLTDLRKQGGVPGIGTDLPHGTKVRKIGEGHVGSPDGQWVPIEIVDEKWLAEESFSLDLGKITNKKALEVWTKSPPGSKIKMDSGDMLIYIHSGLLARFGSTPEDLPVATEPPKLEPTPPSPPGTVDKPSSSENSYDKWTKREDGHCWHTFEKASLYGFDVGLPGKAWRDVDTPYWQYRVVVSTARDSQNNAIATEVNSVKGNPESGITAAEAANNAQGPNSQIGEIKVLEVLDENDADTIVSKTPKDAVEMEAYAATAPSSAEIQVKKQTELQKRKQEAVTKGLRELAIWFNKAKDDELDSVLGDWLSKVSNYEAASSALAGAVMDEYMDTTAGNPTPQRFLVSIPARYFDAIPFRIEDFRYEAECESNGGCFTTQFTPKQLREKIAKVKEILLSFKPDIQKFKDEGGKVVTFDADKEAKRLEEWLTSFENFCKWQSNHTFPSHGAKLLKNGTRLDKSDRFELGAGPDFKLVYCLFKPEPADSGESTQSQDGNLDTSTTPGFEWGKEPGDYFTPLHIGFDWWSQNESSPATWTRTLGYVFYADSMIRKYDAATKGKSNKDEEKPLWIDFISSYSMPPPAIYVGGKSDDSLEECIKKLESLDKFSVKTKEDIIEENKILLDPVCREKLLAAREASYTFIGDSFTQKSKVESLTNQDFKKLEDLYFRICSKMDVNGIIAMLMACLQKQLGIEMTAEAICDAAMIKFMESMPSLDEVKKAIIDIFPDAAPFIMPLPAGQTPQEKLLEKLGGEDGMDVTDPEDRRAFREQFADTTYAYWAALGGASAEDVAKIAAFERGGTVLSWKPALTPGTNPISGQQEMVPMPQDWIDQRREELEAEGHSYYEAQARLVEEGYLVVDTQRTEGYVTETLDAFEDFGNNLSSAGIEGAPGFGTQGMGNPTLRSQGQAIANGASEIKRFYEELKEFIDIRELCEKLVGISLDFPAALFQKGGFGNLGARFEAAFKLPKLPQFALPDSFPTDNLVGDYEKKMKEYFEEMLVTMLAKIFQALLEELLLLCFDENQPSADQGRGPTTGEIPFSDLLNDQDLSPLSDHVPNVPTIDIKDWLSATFNILTPSELCSLLRGNATKKVLLRILRFTKAGYPKVFSGGLNNIPAIEEYFIDLGKRVNLEVCDFLEPVARAANDLCDETYDYDARCEALMNMGLTELECQEQIDKEIKAMQDKIFDLANLAMQDPLVIPPPDFCGPNGPFSLPDSMKHSAGRMLDLMFDNVRLIFNNDYKAVSNVFVPDVTMDSATIAESFGDGENPGTLENSFKTLDVQVLVDNRTLFFDTAPGTPLHNEKQEELEEKGIALNPKYNIEDNMPEIVQALGYMPTVTPEQVLSSIKGTKHEFKYLHKFDDVKESIEDRLGSITKSYHANNLLGTFRKVHDLDSTLQQVNSDQEFWTKFGYHSPDSKSPGGWSNAQHYRGATDPTMDIWTTLNNTHFEDFSDTWWAANKGLTLRSFFNLKVPGDQIEFGTKNGQVAGIYLDFIHKSQIFEELVNTFDEEESFTVTKTMEIIIPTFGGIVMNYTVNDPFSPGMDFSENAVSGKFKPLSSLVHNHVVDLLDKPAGVAGGLNFSAKQLKATLAFDPTPPIQSGELQKEDIAKLADIITIRLPENTLAKTAAFQKTVIMPQAIRDQAVQQFLSHVRLSFSNDLDNPVLWNLIEDEIPDTVNLRVGDYRPLDPNNYSSDPNNNKFEPVSDVTDQTKIKVQGWNPLDKDIQDMLTATGVDWTKWLNSKKIKTAINKGADYLNEDDPLLGFKSIKPALFADFLTRKLLSYCDKPEESPTLYSETLMIAAHTLYPSIFVKVYKGVFELVSNTNLFRRDRVRALLTRLQGGTGSGITEDVCTDERTQDEIEEDNGIFDLQALKDEALERYEDLKCQETFNQKKNQPGSLQMACQEALVMVLLRLYGIEILFYSIPSFGTFTIDDINGSDIIFNMTIQKMKEELESHRAGFYEVIASTARRKLTVLEEEQGFEYGVENSAIRYFLEREIQDLKDFLEEAVPEALSIEDQVLNGFSPLIRTQIHQEKRNGLFAEPAEIDASIPQDIYKPQPLVNQEDGTEPLGARGRFVRTPVVGPNGYMVPCSEKHQRFFSGFGSGPKIEGPDQYFGNTGGFIIEPYIRLEDKKYNPFYFIIPGQGIQSIQMDGTDAAAALAGVDPPNRKSIEDLFRKGYESYHMGGVVDPGAFSQWVRDNNWAGLVKDSFEIYMGLRLVYVAPTNIASWTNSSQSYTGFQWRIHNWEQQIKAAHSIKKNKECKAILQPESSYKLPVITIPLVEVEEQLILEDAGFRMPSIPLTQPLTPETNYGVTGPGFKRSSDPIPYSKISESDHVYFMAELVNTGHFEMGEVSHYEQSNRLAFIFYRDIAPVLEKRLLETPEYKFIFEYCIPIKEQVASTVPYFKHSFNVPGALGGRTTSGHDIDSTFTSTKNTLFKQYDSLSNSQDYQYENPDAVSAVDNNQENSNSLSMSGKGLEGLAAFFAVNTPVQILKGFVQLTDPCVGTAMAVIEASYQLVMAGINIAKQVAQQAVDIANQNLSSAEDILNQLKDQKATFMAQADPLLEPQGISLTQLNVEENPPPWPDNLPESMKEAVEQLDEESRQVFDQVAEIEQAIYDQEQVVLTLKDAVKTAEDEVKKIIEDAEQTVKDVKASPWTLPLTSLAMMPSAVPFGIGFPPPYLGGPGIGPPMTAPGAIYLAVHYLDDFEKAQANQLDLLKCD